MNRKRHRLVPEAFGQKRRREGGDVEADPLRGESGSARAAVAELLRLFPRVLFEDALPPIALRSQVYSLVPDRTVADRQLVRGVRATDRRRFRALRALTRFSPSLTRSTSYSAIQQALGLSGPGIAPGTAVPRRMLQRACQIMKKALQEQGEIRIIQLGFDSDAQGIIFTEDYRTRVLKACDGRPYAGAVQKFLASVLPACSDLSFQQDQMIQTFGFRDPEITQLVNAGVLTVRDAGSWWLAVPGAGRFIKCFVKGRQAVLGMVRKAKYRELLLSELLGRRAPAAARLGLAYHVHDLIGAQLVDCVSTTSGTLLRLPET
ncbi:serine/threonine-protein kinase 19 isoform X2 [Neophocaena asiaeorientalis asiaeorientalis]|uniref:Serine/threonine-protein kinase 19 isoform X2 n=1 Tax=Neophocaena asiaeorientalis asiaeorientalis TaxID=1706337 RepID=A0A341AWN7_NEOAA|nr:serine/threonine-protein kinase 19 isoform X2 [Neophocaena asiaeorientalis asiaeorientalis]